MPQTPQNLREFKAFVEIVKALRGPDGCPWDKEQTHQSLTRYALEEAYELAEAIDQASMPQVKEELGDLLLQVVLHAEIASQSGSFSIEDVIETISQKMVRRHPHVFSDTKVSGSAEVVANWQAQKAKEKAQTPKPYANPFDLPADMPALLRSQKIGEKTRSWRFDWSQVKDVMSKVQEEWDETKSAIQNESRERQQAEIGDLLFSVAQLARHLGLDAEQSLRIANRRFETRFQAMRDLANSRGQDFSKLTETQLESLWQEVKK